MNAFVEAVHLQHDLHAQGMEQAGVFERHVRSVGEHFGGKSLLANEPQHFHDARVDHGLAAQDDDLARAQIPGLEDDAPDLVGGEFTGRLGILPDIAVSAVEIAPQAELDLHGQQAAASGGRFDVGEAEFLADHGRVTTHGFFLLSKTRRGFLDSTEYT